MTIALRLDSQVVSPDRVLKSVMGLLNRTQLCSVATVLAGGKPHINTCFFAFDRDLRLVILTPPSTVHASAWENPCDVAVAVFDSHQVSGAELSGLQLFGHVTRSRNESEQAALLVYGERFPSFKAAAPDTDTFLRTFQSRFYLVSIERLKLFDEPAFGKEVWIEASIVHT